MDNQSPDKLRVTPHVVDTNFWWPLFHGVLIIVFGVGGFFVWAFTAPLDAGVVADGTVTISDDIKKVQHLNGGRVVDILVKEGDVVKKDQPLMMLDKTQVATRYSALSSQYLVAKSIEDRLLSERDGLPAVMFSDKITESYKTNHRLHDVLSLQKKLFATRSQAVNGELAMLDETILGLQNQITQLTDIKASRTRQLALIDKELQAVRKLSEKNYYPKAQMLSLEREVAELSGKLSEDILNVGRLNSQINELKLKKFQQHHEYIQEVESELTNQQKEVATLEDELLATKYEMDNTVIRTPIDGVILGINVTTIGGIIQPGEKLMDVVPENKPLQIDAKIPVQAIDKLVPGLTVDILFPALNHALLPSIPGKVLTVSADRLVDDVTQQPYFLAEIEVMKEGIYLLGENKIRAGMPASVTVKTGERTMFNYLLKPFLARLELALKES